MIRQIAINWKLLIYLWRRRSAMKKKRRKQFKKSPVCAHKLRICCSFSKLNRHESQQWAEIYINNRKRWKKISLPWRGLRTVDYDLCSAWKPINHENKHTNLYRLVITEVPKLSWKRSCRFVSLFQIVLQFLRKNWIPIQSKCIRKKNLITINEVFVFSFLSFWWSHLFLFFLRLTSASFRIVCTKPLIE